MTEMTDLPAVLDWMAERWPERCERGTVTDAWLHELPGSAFRVLLDGEWQDALVGRVEHPCRVEYLIRELIAERGWAWSLYGRDSLGDFRAIVSVRGSGKDSWRVGGIEHARTPLLALANAFREALDE